MTNPRRLTAIELLTMLVLIGLFLVVAIPAFARHANGDGIVCKGGYTFTGRDSSSVQIIDAQGHGIPCETR